jgi:prepilin-type N-terminal cleavage/methylation domain-containing protein
MEVTKNNRGFTLVELIIVIVILAIVGIFVGIRSPSIDLPNQTLQVINDIRYAQSLAISSNLRHRFYFASNTYSIASYDQSTNHETSIYFPQTKSTSVALNSNILFSKPPTPNCVAFNGRGQPCNCVNGMLFTNETTIRLITRLTSKDIIITPSTGFIYEK